MDVSWFSHIAFQRFYLDSVGLTVAATALLADEKLCALAAEDIAWSAAMADWHGRKPGGHRTRCHRRWVGEGTYLFAERDRLRGIARDRGLPV